MCGRLGSAAADQSELLTAFMTKIAQKTARKCHKLIQFHICSPRSRGRCGGCARCARCGQPLTATGMIMASRTAVVGSATAGHRGSPTAAPSVTPKIRPILEESARQTRLCVRYSLYSSYSFQIIFRGERGRELICTDRNRLEPIAGLSQLKPSQSPAKNPKI